MVVVPTLTALTMPPPLMVATDGLLLLQVPPGTLFESVEVLPIDTEVVPVIAPGVRPAVTTMLLTADDGQAPDVV